MCFAGAGSIINLHSEKSTHRALVQSGGFVDTMVIEMADFGVDVLISSDHNFVVETIARELGMTLMEIDHYVSERYGLYFMQRILGTAFPDIPVTILENIESIQCTCEECSCNEMFTANHTPNLKSQY
jgi:putative NIF3 family GTP cyclohydrolase 1 type 2